MHDPVLIDIPFWYDAKVVRQRCRNEDDVVLRSSAPFAMPHLAAAEAPPALTVEIEWTPGNRRSRVDITWRSDGNGYLRPLRVHRGEMPRHDFDFAHDGEPMTAADLRAVLGFAQQFHFSSRDFPERWAYDRNPKLNDVRIGGRRHQQVDPRTLPTPRVYEAVVKTWIRTAEAESAVEALRGAQAFVMVDGIVHRRVPAPVWGFSGTASLWHGEALRRDDPTMMWPLSLTEDFDDFIRRLPPHACPIAEATVDHHIAPDADADLARIGGLLLDALWKHVVQAVPHLSDESLDSYKTMRALRPSAGSDLSACKRALAELDATLADPGWDAAKKYPFEKLKTHVAQHVGHWKRLLHASGDTILTAQEDEAISALS